MDFATLRFDTTDRAVLSGRRDDTDAMSFPPAPNPRFAPGGSPEPAVDAAVAERLRQLRAASAQGSAEAQYELGCLFRAGQCVTRDDAEAACWWGLAALGGHARAQCELGVLHLSGSGVTHDHAIARMWLECAAAQHDAAAQYQLGMLALEPSGDGAEVAARWFEQSSVRGHACAQYRLGLAYRDGAGVACDDEYAMHWLDAASAQGCALAAYALAELGWRGRRVPPRRVPRAGDCALEPSAAVCCKRN